MFAVFRNSNNSTNSNQKKVLFKTHSSQPAKTSAPVETPKNNIAPVEKKQLFQSHQSSNINIPIIEKSAPSALTSVSSEPKEKDKEIKRIKFRMKITRDVPYSKQSTSSNSNRAPLIKLSKSSELRKENKMKQVKQIKEMKQVKKKRIGEFNCGRWTEEEHRRFIEAIIKYGNNWKSVQAHVSTRSSAQARSHAQKFFYKIKSNNFTDLKLDLSKTTIQTLHELANTLEADEYFKALKKLNCLPFERKPNLKKRRTRNTPASESSDEEEMSERNQNSGSQTFFDNNDEIFLLNTNENTLFNSGKFCELGLNLNSFLQGNIENSLINSGNYQIIIQNDQINEQSQKKPQNCPKSDKFGNVNTIIINNKINTYNYNVNINNITCNESKTEFLNNKRNRMNSCEGLVSLFPDLGKDCTINFNTRKIFDENEYANNFNVTFKSVKNDFEEEPEENIIEEIYFLSEEPSGSRDNILSENSIKNIQSEDEIIIENFEIRDDNTLRRGAPIEEDLSNIDWFIL